MSILKRILSRVKKEQRREYLDECWIWQGAGDKNGYRTVHWCTPGKIYSMRAHRYVYSILIEKIPKGKIICHHCDQPACCNPDHLFMGTALDNSLDMKNKGRARYGERHVFSVLTDDVVLNARERHINGETQQSIADDIGVSKSAVMHAVRGETWGHVGGEISNQQPKYTRDKELEKTVIAMAKKGVGSREIAEMLNISPTMAFDLSMRDDVLRRTKENRPAKMLEETDLVVKMHKEGYCFNLIEQCTGIKKSTAHRYYKKAMSC